MRNFPPAVRIRAVIFRIRFGSTSEICRLDFILVRMPGGTPLKKMHSPIFDKIVLQKLEGPIKTWKWKCKHCDELFSWCSVKRTTMHVACVGKFISHCKLVPDPVWEKYAAAMTLKESQKRKRKLDADAVEEAAATRAAEHEDRTREKLKRGILVLKDGKMLEQRLRKGAFGCGDTLKWCLLDEELVDFWCLHGLPINLLNTKRLNRIFTLVRKTPTGSKPPDPRNEGRPSSFENMLQGRNEDVRNGVNSEFSRIIVCGAMVVSDAATVHRRSVSNFMLKAAVHKLPLMLDFVDSTSMLQNGEERDAPWYAHRTIDLIQATPNSGHSIVMMVGDTVAEQLVMFDLIELTCPWILK